MENVIQIVIAKYPNTADAEAALKRIHETKENQGVEVFDAAVVWRADDGKLHIHETADVTGGRGATVGGILGGILGIIAGPAGVVAGAAVGAAVGGAAASMFDSGIPHERLQAIGTSLQPDSAALVILTEAGFVPFLETVLEQDGVEVSIETMNPVQAESPDHDHDTALKALKMGDALASGGMAAPSKDE
jgi:uncharacterized membrane protein